MYAYLLCAWLHGAVGDVANTHDHTSHDSLAATPITLPLVAREAMSLCGGCVVTATP